MQYIVSFIEGIITFISPCLLPMLPIYLSYFAGGGERSTRKTLLGAAGFVLGFTAVFTALGALAGTLGSLLIQYSTLVNIILGLIVIVFGLNSGAYISEIMRGGILSVDPGQMEGGRSLGLGFSVAMTKIVIPQAIKNILPTMGNEFITLIKETSIVSFIGAVDLYKAFNNIGTNTYEFMVPYIVMAMIYIVLVLIISMLIKLMERSLRKSDRSM